jgi:hypothetical protein
MEIKAIKIKLFENTKIQEKCPIQIIEYKIIKKEDNNNQIINKRLEVTFKNIGNKKISAFKGEILLTDSFGETLEPEEFSIIELDNFQVGNIIKHELKEDINTEAVYVDIIVKHIMFYDRSNWMKDEENSRFIELEKPIIPDQQDMTIYQYHWRNILSNEIQFQNLILDTKDYWVCSCGSVNYKENDHCYNCNTAYNIQTKYIDLINIKNEIKITSRIRNYVRNFIRRFK